MDMNERDDIEVEYLEPETVEEEIFEHQRKSGVGFIPILGVGVAAAILGAVGGAFGAQYFAPKPDLSAVQTQIERAVADVKDMNEKEVAGLKKTVQTLRQQTIENMDNGSKDIETSNQLSELEARLSSLENTPAPTLPDISPETLSALQSAQADGFTWPDTDELETELSDVKAELALLKTEINELQTQSFKIDEVVTDQIVAQGLVIEEVSFPMDNLLAAVKTDNEEQGFLARTLNKHVKVKEADDPVILIEQISNAIDNNDMKTAITNFDKLPEDLRNIAQDWRNSVQVN